MINGVVLRYRVLNKDEHKFKILMMMMMMTMGRWIFTGCKEPYAIQRLELFLPIYCLQFSITHEPFHPLVLWFYFCPNKKEGA